MDESGIEATQALPFDDYDEDVTDDESSDRPAAYLNVPLQKGFPGKQFPLLEGDNIIGRSEECKICIPLKGLSREHACIEVHGSSHFIYDKGSRNRTRRNKHFLAASVRYELKDKDQLIFGDVECEYQLNAAETPEDLDETGSEHLFQTAPSDDTSGEPVQASDKPSGDIEEDGFESDASSDILEPSQKFTSGTQSMLKPKSMLGDKTIGQNLTVKETPMQSRTKRFIDDIVLPESGSETEEEEETVSRPPATLIVADSQDDSVGEKSALLAAATQAYVCDSDATTDEEDITASKRSLLMAPTQAFVQEDSDVSTCSEASPVKRRILTAATQAYAPDSDNDVAEGPGSHLMFEPTQAYPGMAAEDDKEDAQSDTSEEFVLEGDTDTEDNMDPNILGAATLAVETQFQGLDDTAEDDGAAVAVEDQTQAVGDDKGKGTTGDETVAVAETQMVDSDISPTKSPRRKGPVNPDDATQVIMEGEGTEINEGKVDVHVFEMETQVIGDEATQVIDGDHGNGKINKKARHTNVSVDNIAETQVFDDSTLAVDDYEAKRKTENKGEGIDIDATQVIDEDHAFEKVNKGETRHDGCCDLATQVFDEPGNKSTKTVDREKSSNDEIGDVETQAFSDAEIETFDVNAAATLAVEADIAVPSAENDEADKDEVEATQVFDTCDATLAIHNEVKKGPCAKRSKSCNDATQVFDDATVTGDASKNCKKQVTTKQAKKNICDDATQVFDDATVAVTEYENETCKKPAKKKAAKNICDDAKQGFDDATVVVIEDTFETSQKKPAKKKSIKKNICDDATQVFDDISVAVTDDVSETYKKPTKKKAAKKNICDDATQVLDDATVAVNDDTDESSLNKVANKHTGNDATQVFDEATVAVDEDSTKVHEEKQTKSKKGVRNKICKQEMLTSKMANTERQVVKNSELVAETQVFDEVTLSLQDAENSKDENKNGNENEAMDCNDATQMVEETAHTDNELEVTTGVKRKRGGKSNTPGHTHIESAHMPEKPDESTVEMQGKATSTKRRRKANEQMHKEPAAGTDTSVNTHDIKNDAVVEADDVAGTKVNKPLKRGRASKISQQTMETKETLEQTEDESKAIVKEGSEEAAEDNTTLGRGRRSRSKKITTTAVKTDEEQMGVGKGKARKTVENKFVNEPVDVEEVKSRSRRGKTQQHMAEEESKDQVEEEESKNQIEGAETQVYASDSETEATQKYDMDEDDDATPELDQVNSTPAVPIVVVSPSKTPLKSALASPKKKPSPSPKRVAFRSQNSTGSNSSQETRLRRSRVKVNDAMDMEAAETGKEESSGHSAIASTRRGRRSVAVVDKVEHVQNAENNEPEKTRKSTKSKQTLKQVDNEKDSKEDNNEILTEIENVDHAEEDHTEPVVETATRSKPGKGRRKTIVDMAAGPELKSTEAGDSVKDVSGDQNMDIGVTSKVEQSVVPKRGSRSKGMRAVKQNISEQNDIATVSVTSKIKNKVDVDDSLDEKNTTGVRQHGSAKSEALVSSKMKDADPEYTTAEGSKDGQESDLVSGKYKVLKGSGAKVTQKGNNIDKELKQEQNFKVHKQVNSRRRTRNKVNDILNESKVDNAKVENTLEQTRDTATTDDLHAGETTCNENIAGKKGRTKAKGTKQETLHETNTFQVANNSTNSRKSRKKGEEESTECDTETGESSAIKNELDSSKQQAEDIEKDNNNQSKGIKTSVGKRKGCQSGKGSQKTEAVSDESIANTTLTENSVAKRGQRGMKLQQEDVETKEVKHESIVNTTVSETNVSKRGKRGNKEKEEESGKEEAAADESIVNTTVGDSGVAIRGRRGKKVEPEDVETKAAADESVGNTTVSGASEAKRGQRGKKAESKVKVEAAEVSGKEALPIAGSLKRKESDSDSQMSLEEKPGKRRKKTLDPAETPKHKNKRLSAVGTPSTRDTGLDSTVTSSPALRKTTTDGQKAKVMFTGVVDEHGEKIVKELGGELVNSAAECTHLVTDQVRRTVKFLCCLSLGTPIVTPQWLVSSKNSAFFTDWTPFLIRDDASEKKYKFILQLSLDKARSKALFEGYSVHVTKSVKPPPDQMKEILKCAGAKVLASMPKTPHPLTVVVSCPEDKSMCDPAVRTGVRVVSPEFVLTGVLRQEVDMDAYSLFTGDQGTKRMSLNTSTVSEPGGKKRRK